MANTRSSVKSANNYIQDALNGLTCEHPKWSNPESNRETICIPDNFETVRRCIAKRTGAKDKAAKTECRSAVTEQKVFDALKDLDIGAIVVSNFDMKIFRYKAEAVYEQYKMLMEDYNKSEISSAAQMDGKDSESGSISEDFESEFILFHPRIGICCIEVKSVCSAGTIKKAKTQVQQVPLKLTLLFRAINETDMCEIPIRAIAIFPNDNLSDRMKSMFKITNPDVQIFGKEKGGFSQKENFRRFWMNIIDQSQNDDLFANERFQRFIAVLCCYRGAFCLNGTLNALRVAELVQQQLLTPKMKSWKAAQLTSRREVHLDSIDSSPDIIFLTEEQQKMELCSDRLQLIFGAPGTGKTLLLLLQILKAAQDADSTGRLFVQCMPSYRKKFENFSKANKAMFAPGRKPILVSSNMDFDINDRDDIFIDESGTGNEEVKFLAWRIKSHGRTVCVVTNDVYPNIYASYRENFTSLRKNYTIHTLKTVMRGTLNIVNSWREYVIGADFFVGHSIAGPKVKPSIMCSTIGETLTKVYECVMKLIEKGVLPKYIAVITYFATEAMMVRKFIEKESGKQIEVTDAGELKNGAGSVVVDETTNMLSQEWPFVIVCSLFCVDMNDSFMLIACSRAIGHLTIIQRDYQSMQLSIEKYIPSHSILTSSAFSCFRQSIEETMNLYLNGKSEIHNFVYNVHTYLTVLRLNIFPKSNEYANQTFQSCHSFTDVLELVMQDSTLMRQVTGDFSAYYKKLFPQIQKINATAKMHNCFIERLLLNVNYSEAATSGQKIETYKQFSLMLAESVYDFFPENQESQENESLPRVFPLSIIGHEYWLGLLDFLQFIFICRKHYLRPQCRITSIDSGCQLRTIKMEDPMLFWAGFLFRKNSTWKPNEGIDRNLRYIDGVYEQYMKQNYTKLCSNVDAHAIKPLGFDIVLGCFTWLLCGFIVSLLFLIFELFYNRRKESKKTLSFIFRSMRTSLSFTGPRKDAIEFDDINFSGAHRLNLTNQSFRTK